MKKSLNSDSRGQCDFEEIQCRKKKLHFLCYFTKHSDWKDILLMLISFMYW